MCDILYLHSRSHRAYFFQCLYDIYVYICISPATTLRDEVYSCTYRLSLNRHSEPDINVIVSLSELDEDSTECLIVKYQDSV